MFLLGRASDAYVQRIWERDVDVKAKQSGPVIEQLDRKLICLNT
jgi:hypothetical protein